MMICSSLCPHCPCALYRPQPQAILAWGRDESQPVWEDKGMRLKQQWWSVLVAAVLGGLVGVTAVAAAGEQFLPVLGIREGGQRFVDDPACRWLHRLFDPPQ